jgi:outer membrane protein assembly factor BamB
VWKSQDEKITHATPVLATIHGVRQVIFFAQSGLVAVRTSDGKALWRFPFRYSVSTAASAVVADDMVYCSAGYGVGGGACKITKSGNEFKATELWKISGDKKVANHWSFKEYGKGPLKCVVMATGQVKWEQSGFGAGQVILAKDRVIALTDAGEVVVVAADCNEYKELARTKAVTGKCWSTPALANGRLYVRSTKEGACFDVNSSGTETAAAR